MNEPKKEVKKSDTLVNFLIVIFILFIVFMGGYQLYQNSNNKVHEGQLFELYNQTNPSMYKSGLYSDNSSLADLSNYYELYGSYPAFNPSQYPAYVTQFKKDNETPALTVRIARCSSDLDDAAIPIYKLNLGYSDKEWNTHAFEEQVYFDYKNENDNKKPLIYNPHWEGFIYEDVKFATNHKLIDKLYTVLLVQSDDDIKIYFAPDKFSVDKTSAETEIKSCLSAFKDVYENKRKTYQTWDKK